MENFLRRRALIDYSGKTIFEASDIVFTGSNYIDTGFKAYSAENIDKDLLFTIVHDDLTRTTNQAAIFGCKYEGSLNGKSYPGFYYRFHQSDTVVELATSGSVKIQKNMADVANKTLFISRRSGSWYFKIENGAENRINPTNATVFDFSLLIGAARQVNGTIFRYTKSGTIKYFKIEYI